MWEFLRMRLGRPVGVVSITSSAARSTETVNGGGVPRLVVSLLRLGLNRAPVRLLSSPYILLSVGRCRVLSGAIGTSRELLCWAVGRAALGGAGALVFSPRELIRGPALGSGGLRRSGAGIWESGPQGLRENVATTGALWAPLGSSGLWW